MTSARSVARRSASSPKLTEPASGVATGEQELVGLAVLPEYPAGIRNV